MKNKKRSIVVGLLAVMALLLLPFAVFAENGQTAAFEGSGTEEEPWLIQSAADLKKLSDTVKRGVTFAGNFFKITEDLDLSEICGKDVGGKEISWTPIGGKNTLFAGTVDGDFRTITGLYIHSEDDFQGLFGCTAGMVENLTVNNGSVTGGNHTGGIAGCNYGTLKHVSFSGSVTGESNTGGIAGSSGAGSRIETCSSDATVLGNKINTGGIAGYAAPDCTISEASHTGNVKGVDAVGGITGYSECSLKSLQNNGSVSGNKYVGGISGFAANLVQDCKNNAQAVIKGFRNIGGIAGYALSGLVSCTNSGTVAGRQIGEQEVYILGMKAPAAAAAGSTGGEKNAENPSATPGGASYKTPGSNDAIIIKDPAIEYPLIDSGNVQIPGMVGGIAGRTGSSAYVKDCLNDNSGKVTGALYVGGMIGESDSPVISSNNTGTVYGSSYVGGIAGFSRAAISDSLSIASVTGYNDEIGGIAGETSGDLIRCVNKGQVHYENSHAGRNIGGIAGSVSGNITECRNEVSLEGVSQVGGIAGNSTGAISGCTNTGDSTGKTNVGGIAGSTEGTISDCNNAENVTAQETGAGGIAGVNKGTVTQCEYNNEKDKKVSGNSMVGGIVGVNQGTVAKCINHGSIESTTYAGGIAGGNEKEVKDCTNNGPVKSMTYAGGIVGGNEKDIKDCTNNGSVKSTTYAGGIAGENDGPASNCINNGNIESGETAGGIAGGGTGTILNSTNGREVVITARDKVGSIAGSYAGTIKDYSTVPSVTLKGYSNVGGVAGVLERGGIIKNCKNYIALKRYYSGSPYGFGGITGRNEGCVEHCFNCVPLSYEKEVNNLGGISGFNAQGATIKNCGNLQEAPISSAGDNCGGIVGSDEGGSILNSWNAAPITFTWITKDHGYGGIVGETKGTVSGCRNCSTAKIQTRLISQCTGGIAGKVDTAFGNIDDCQNDATVIGGFATGGIAGYIGEDAFVGNCKNGAGSTVKGADKTDYDSGFGVEYTEMGWNEAGEEVEKTIAVVLGLGGIAGVSEGTVDHCVNEALVTTTIGEDYTNKNLSGVGGIIGSSGIKTGGDCFSCTNTGDVYATLYRTEGVGGIAGFNKAGASTIANCINRGNVTGCFEVGGIAGYGATIESCVNHGTIKAGKKNQSLTESIDHDSDRVWLAYNSCAGGIAGTDYRGSITNCGNFGDVSGVGCKVGGIVGNAQGMSVSDCMNLGASITGYEGVGGIIGYTTPVLAMSRCFEYDSEVECDSKGTLAIHTYWGWLIGSGGTNMSTDIKDCFYSSSPFYPHFCDLPGAYNTYRWGYYYVSDTSNPNNFDGKAKPYYAEDDPKFALNAEGLDMRKADSLWIMEKNNAEYPILKIMDDESGFYEPGNPSLEKAEDITISNLHELKLFRDSVNEGKTYADATVTLTADIDLQGEPWEPIGNGGIHDCFFAGTFDGGGHTISGLNVDSSGKEAGFFGQISGARRDEEGTHSYVNATIKDLVVRGKVKVSGLNASAGGIVGTIRRSWAGILTVCKMERCAFYGSVSGGTYSGGLVGRNHGTITDCYHEGEVSGKYAGGIIGANLSTIENGKEPVTNCYHYKGSISGSQNAGGIIGIGKPEKSGNDILNGSLGVKNVYYLDSSVPSGSYGIGLLTNRTTAIEDGGLFVPMSLIDKKLDRDIDGAVEKRTNDEFKKKASFNGWDFENVWAITNLGMDSPRLRSSSTLISMGDGTTGPVGFSIAKWMLNSGEQVYDIYGNRGTYYFFAGWTNTGSRSVGYGKRYADWGVVVPTSNMYLDPEWIRGLPYSGNYEVLSVTEGYEGYSGNEHTKLLDGSKDTKWCDKATSNEPWSIEFKTEDPVRPVGFCLTTGGDTEKYPERNPVSWKLEGKAKGQDGNAAWVLLAEKEDLTAELPPANLVDCWYSVIDRNTYFSEYRLTLQQKENTTFQLQEFRLLITDKEPEPLLTFHSGTGTRIQNVNFLDKVALPSPEECGFTGSNFAGWNTQENGSGTTYYTGEELLIDKKTDLYAQWNDGTPYSDYVPLSATHSGVSGQGYGEMFDQNPDTKWCVTDLKQNEKWSVEFATRDYVKPYAYALTTGGDTASHPDRNPKNWKLEGKTKKDGTWETLTNVTNDNRLPAENKASVYWGLNSAKEYCYFRLTFSGPLEKGKFQLSEFTLLTKDPNTDIRKPVITFDPRGGTNPNGEGVLQTQSADNEKTVKLIANRYSKDGSLFAGWSEFADGGGTAIADEGNYNVAGDSTLYAIWKSADAEKTCTVIWVNEDGKTLLDTQEVAVGAIPVYKGAAPSKEPEGNYRFDFTDWTPNLARVTDDATYKAVYTKVLDHCDVSFDAGGGTGTMDPVSVSGGDEYTLPDGSSFTAPSGADFFGWRVSGADDTILSAGAKITVSENTHLSAVWKETHNGIDFISWCSADRLPEKSGCYFLTGDVSLAGYGADGWTAPSGTIRLCLFGKKITGGEERTPLHIPDNGVVEIYDHEGGGITGVQIDNKGAFTIFGGTFRNAPFDNQTDLRIFGGTISGVENSPAINNSGTLKVSGGKISGNNAGDANAVISSSGTLTVTDGVITQNKGAAAVLATGSVNLYDTPVIKDNVRGEDETRNLVLGDAKTKILVGALNGRAEVGVTMANPPGVFGEPEDGYTITGADTTHFFSDDADYIVKQDADGNIILAQKPAPGEKVLARIAVTTKPKKTDYYIGESFDKTGMVVTAYYSDESSAEAGTITVEPSGELAETDTFVTIYYTEDGVTKMTTQAITVTPVPQEYTVTVTASGNGTATADLEKGTEGTTVKLTASAEKGSHFKEWKVIKGGVTVTNNSFAIGTANVEIEAVFEELIKTEKVDATCTEEGTEAYWTGSVCGKMFSDEAGGHEIKKPVAIPPKGHDWGAWVVTKPATAKEDGEKQRVCKRDPSHVETQRIPAPGEKEPEGKTSGIPFAKMTSKGKKSLMIAWTKVKGAAGYDIFFTECNHKKARFHYVKVKTIKGNSRFTYTKSGLKKNTSYKARVKAYVFVNGKKKYVSASAALHTYTGDGNAKYTNAKSVKVNRKAVTLRKGKTFKIRAIVRKVDPKKQLVSKSHAPTLRFQSTNTKVASVSASGKIKAQGKGTCYVYAFAHNGVSKRIKVTVK